MFGLFIFSFIFFFSLSIFSLPGNSSFTILNHPNRQADSIGFKMKLVLCASVLVCFCSCHSLSLFRVFFLCASYFPFISFPFYLFALPGNSNLTRLNHPSLHANSNGLERKFGLVYFFSCSFCGGSHQRGSLIGSIGVGVGLVFSLKRCNKFSTIEG